MDAQIGGKITRTEEPEIELPMREWFERRLPIGAQTADKATAVAVLHCIHETMSPPSAIKIVAKQHDDVITKVRATRDIAAKSICIPPCVPKQSNVVNANVCSHPHAVPLELSILIPKDAQ